MYILINYLRSWFVNPKFIWQPWKKRYLIFVIGFLDIYLLSYLYYRHLFNKLTPEQQKQVKLEQKTPMTRPDLAKSLNLKISYKALLLFFIWLMPFRMILSHYLLYDLQSAEDRLHLKQPESDICSFASMTLVFTPIHLPYCYGIPKYRKAFQPNFIEEERVREARRNCYFSLMRDAGQCSYYLHLLRMNGEYDKAQRFLDRWDPIRLKNKDHPGYCRSNSDIAWFYRSIDDLDKVKKYEDIFEGCREEAGL